MARTQRGARQHPSVNALDGPAAASYPSLRRPGSPAFQNGVVLPATAALFCEMRLARLYMPLATIPFPNAPISAHAAASLCTEAACRNCFHIYQASAGRLSVLSPWIVRTSHRRTPLLRHQPVGVSAANQVRTTRARWEHFSPCALAHHTHASTLSLSLCLCQMHRHIASLARRTLLPKTGSTHTHVHTHIRVRDLLLQS